MSIYLRATKCGVAVFSALSVVFAFATMGAATVQQASAKMFVESIYKPYLKKKFKGVEYSRPVDCCGATSSPRLQTLSSRTWRPRPSSRRGADADASIDINAQDWKSQISRST